MKLLVVVDTLKESLAWSMAGHFTAPDPMPTNPERDLLRTSDHIRTRTLVRHRAIAHQRSVAPLKQAFARSCRRPAAGRVPAPPRRAQAGPAAHRSQHPSSHLPWMARPSARDGATVRCCQDTPSATGYPSPAAPAPPRRSDHRNQGSSDGIAQIDVEQQRQHRNDDDSAAQAGERAQKSGEQRADAYQRAEFKNSHSVWLAIPEDFRPAKHTNSQAATGTSEGLWIVNGNREAGTEMEDRAW